MEIETQAFLPLDLAIKYYSKWDCDVQTKIHNQIYYKFLTGIGHVQYHNGNAYHGMFQNGLMHGQGTYTWLNGLSYEGTFVDNNVTGSGRLSWKDGSYYIGQVKNGRRDGEGQYFCQIDKSSYKGLWSNGLKQGKGLLTFANGAVYQGQFQSGMREGTGKMRYPSGNEYEGQWKKDKKEGQGSMSWYSSLQKYEGDWKNDLPDGQGTYFWFQTRQDTKIIKTIYKGQWHKGKRQGYGSFFYNNGCRMEGTFTNNMKQGLCAITDQFGETHLQHFTHDKALSKDSKGEFKLPQLHKPIIHNNEPTQNTYRKIVDINTQLIDDSIFNLLLRENSHLRTDYKTLISSTSRQIFNGLNIEGLWKVVKEMKVTNHWLTLAKLNRCFFSGHKAQFDVQTPNKTKLQLLKKNQKVLEEYHYQDFEWDLAFQKFKKMELDWSQWPKTTPTVNIQEINLKNDLELHNQNQIVLFRHFIVFLLHITLLQHQQATFSGQPISFRKCLEDILRLVKVTEHPVSNMPSLKTQKLTSQIMTNFSLSQHPKLGIPKQYADINKNLINELNAGRSNLLNKIDQTVSVKQIYCLLCQCGILKQASEKMLFLQRIERSMNCKGSLIRKQNKIHYPAFEKIVLTSSHFAHIMNYEMIGIQFDQILYKLLNRKIRNTHSKEQFLNLYSQTIKNMINQLKKTKEEIQKPKKSVGFKWNRRSTKDKQRQFLLQKLEEERIRKQEEQRKEAELKREERERALMSKQDKDIEDEQESQKSQQYYD